MSSNNMMARFLTVTAAALLLSAVMSACSSSTPQKLAPGRCIANEDCPESERCVQGFCEDIYHPRREIKNY